MKNKRFFKLVGVIAVVAVVVVSCKKDKKKDYRDVWVGIYDLEITGWINTLGMTTFPKGEIYFDKNMQEDELGLKPAPGYDDFGTRIFKLADKNGTFVETTDGENYEKGSISSDGTLFYEKKERINSTTLNKITIEGKKGELLEVY